MDFIVVLFKVFVVGENCNVGEIEIEFRNRFISYGILFVLKLLGFYVFV